MFVDVVLGIQMGDEGKGKCVNTLLKKGQYTHSCRVSGGPNCGHTIYFKGQKFATHQVPVGVFYKTTSLIAAGCVVDPTRLREELDEIEKKTGIDASSYLKIAYNAHIITPEHVEEDGLYDRVGSTKRGIMPAYRAKYGRTGLRAEDIPELREFVCDPINDLWFLTEDLCSDLDHKILVEGAQGFYLDIDYGDYPFVTSSPTTSTYALHSLGLPPQTIRKVYGAAKVYETYVGTKPFQPNDEVFKRIQEAGHEYGATTGRVRQINWLHLSDLKRAVAVNGVTDLIISKVDVLRDLNEWVIRDTIKGHNIAYRFDSEEGFKDFIKKSLPRKTIAAVLAGGSPDINVVFSDNPKDI